MSVSIVLQNLIADYGISPTELSRRSGVPQPTVHRLLAGLTKKPNKATTEALCRFFQMSVEQILGEDPIVKVNLEYKQKRIPLVTLENIESDRQNKRIMFFEGGVILTDAHVSQDSFAIISNDSSMEPLFPQGTTLIFDPSQEPKDRSYVIAYIVSDNQAIFRQLIIDGSSMFLKSLNPDISNQIIRKLSSKDLLLGTLIQAKKNYYP